MSAAINDGGPAFPSHGTMGEVAQEGMSLRDYFAAGASTPPGDFMRLIGDDGSLESALDWHVRWSWAYADAMLKARSE